jgi:hypothetical protein
MEDSWEGFFFRNFIKNENLVFKASRRSRFAGVRDDRLCRRSNLFKVSGVGCQVSVNTKS